MPLKQLSQLTILNVRSSQKRQFTFICRHLTQLQQLSIRFDSFYFDEELESMCNLTRLRELHMYLGTRFHFVDWIHMPPMSGLRILTLERIVSCVPGGFYRQIQRNVSRLIPRLFPNLEILDLRIVNLAPDQVRRCHTQLSHMRHLRNGCKNYFFEH